MIEGVKIYLRCMEMEDVACKVKWVNDPEVREMLLFSDFPASKIATGNWLSKVASDPTRKDFIVCLKTNDQPIGFAGLKSIDYQNLKAESYLGIGVKEYWGKGYGYDIKRTLIDYAFNELQLNKIYSYHLTENKAMIKINLQLGGKEEGILREDVSFKGKLFDRVIVSILKAEREGINLIIV